MASNDHHYETTMVWTGNRGSGTATYSGYARDHEITAGAKPVIAGSSDKTFRGDPARWNPEELLVAALSACHQLAYLHLCAVNGITVTAYVDRAEGSMMTDAAGNGHFTRVVLRPEVTVTEKSDKEMALRLHEDAHHHCFIANSVNFPVEHEARILSSVD
ncbi:MAG: OsmC family protein [Candidatus Eremiobacteraeota bacterium]|nr:OsmC family protein [Candidatus Eremiobacteraeota bacterium]